jgi:hypothetical protein
LKQTASAEEYTTQFKSLQYDVTIHGCTYDDLFFATHYVRGLRDDIRVIVVPQRPPTAEIAMVIAKIQHKVIERGKLKYQQRQQNPKAHSQSLRLKPHLPIRPSNCETTKRPTIY